MYNADGVPVSEAAARVDRCESIGTPARKVRAAWGTVLDNIQAEQPGGQPPGQADGKCNRKIPLEAHASSKGEMVR